MIDLDDYRRRQAERQPVQKANGHDTEMALRMLHQAEVMADNLIGDPDWDRFLSYLQSTLDISKGQREDIVRRISSEDIVSDEDIRRLKLLLVQIDERIRTLEAVMWLPRQIKEIAVKGQGE